MKLLLTIFARGLQLAGMLSMPFAIYYGETEKSMSIELQYLSYGIIFFIIGYFIDNKFIKEA